MSLDTPLVSVVIPVYNGERFLSETVVSVLGQTYPCVECIVVDDGSTDGTGEIARSFGDRIRYLEKTNGGVSSARNLGVREAGGEFVAFLDADDLWSPRKLQMQVDTFKRRDMQGILLCGVKFIDEDSEVTGQEDAVEPRELIENILLLGPQTGFFSSTSLVKRSVFHEIGGFDEELSTSADADFVCRAWLKNMVNSIPDHLAMYRRHGNQMHHNLAALEHDMNLVLGRVFSRNDLPTEIAQLRRRAYSSLESVLAIGHLSKRNVGPAFSHLGAAIKHDPGTFIAKFRRLVTLKLGSR